MVEIKDLIGKKIKQGEFFSDIYNEYKVKYKWMIFFDFDEYLVLYDKKHKYSISFQEFLIEDFNNSIIYWLIGSYMMIMDMFIITINL